MCVNTNKSRAAACNSALLKVSCIIDDYSSWDWDFLFGFCGTILGWLYALCF